MIWKTLANCIYLATGTGNSTATQSSADGSADNNLSQHQARLQAAAAAASIYGKSFVYPSPNSPVWSPGYVVLPQSYRPLGDSTNVESRGEQASSGQEQFQNPGASTSFPFAQFPHGFVPFQAPGANVTYGERLEAQKKFIKHQIEVPSQHQFHVFLLSLLNHASKVSASKVLQDQLQQLQKSKPEASSEKDSSELSDGKGKTVAPSLLPVSDCGRHSENEETAS
ncbi:hypothetical protein Patl1_23866 [Pistacia atlantica]|uniref:Uncharacterized protein n=1 Tax=Pistacia atlantica TaxID=434234 RepID=A0ACC1A3H9_9ROSI|nr:hypothetical protein Patl1_23866 [Pistacia atlantica]